MEKTPPITRGRKFAQVLEGARQVFLRDGFEGASVDDIAREAAVSKATLYSYFPDKRLMFIEVFRSELERETDDGSELARMDLPVTQVLPIIARMICNHLSSEFGTRIYRISVAESERFPILAREYYEAGPARVRSHLITYFAARIEKGELQIDDLELAADQLLQLCSAVVQDRAIFLGPDQVTEDMIQRVCDGAVRTFMACYGREPVALKASDAA